MAAHMRWRFIVVILCCWWFVGQAWALPMGHPRAPVARAVATDQAPIIDGRIDEPAWQRSKAHGTFVERKPTLGAVPADKTTFRVLFDAQALYVAVHCADLQPSAIAARTTARDSFAIFSDDAISLKIDPAHDQRTTAGFALNPAGARLEYRGVNESQMRPEFDTTWQGAAAIVEGGWTAEFRVPWTSLGIDPRQPPRRLGLNFSRDHPRRNATYDWALMPPPFSPISASLYGHLVGFESLGAMARDAVKSGVLDARRLDAAAGPPHSLTPWMLGGLSRRSEESGATLEGRRDMGLDLAGQLGGGWRGQLTVNTDFAQVDVDDQVVNLSRFSLFMPEKRDFFMRDVELFTFGRSGRAQLLHSRRIGLDAGQPVPIALGAKVLGSLGDDLRLGAMQVTTRSSGDLPATSHAVGRLQWELGGGSNAGLMWTHRQALDRPGDFNMVLGADGAWRGVGVPLLVEAFALAGLTGDAAARASADVGAATTDATDAGGVGGAASVQATWRGLLWRPRLAWAFYDDDLRADLGFFRRTGIHEGSAGLVWEPRFGGQSLEKLTLEVATDVVRDESLDPLDAGLETSAKLRWKAGYELGAGARMNRETVVSGFGVGRHTHIDAAIYDMNELVLGYGTPSVAMASLSGEVAMRDYYGGQMLITANRVVLRPGGLLRFEVRGEVSQVRFDDARPGFLSVVLNGRAAIGLSPELNLDVFAGWNRLQNLLPAQARLRWTWRAGSDLFVVYQGHFEDDLGGARFQSLMVKATLNLPTRLRWSGRSHAR